jgi:MarR family transcriptional regulator, negative regulator of the multidrug operon emrRAB
MRCRYTTPRGNQAAQPALGGPTSASEYLILSHMTEYDFSVEDRDANLLGAMATGIQDAVRDALESASGFDGTAVAALLAVRERPGQSITQLAAAVNLTHSGAVRSVSRLASRGLVTRGLGRDGRSRGLLLTSRGLAMTERVLAARRARLLDLLAGLPAEERACLAGAMERVLAQLPSSRTDAWRICRTCEHDVCRGPACPVGTAVSAAEA